MCVVCHLLLTNGRRACLVTKEVGEKEWLDEGGLAKTRLSWRVRERGRGGREGEGGREREERREREREERREKREREREERRERERESFSIMMFSKVSCAPPSRLHVHFLDDIGHMAPQSKARYLFKSVRNEVSQRWSYTKWPPNR